VSFREIPYDYLGYQTARQRHVEAFLTHLANWRFANDNLEACLSRGSS
jgi:superoxide dismutase